MNQLYRSISTAKQSFLQMKGRREADLGHGGQILFMVNKIRKDHPCMSAREIYFKLEPQGMGRDKFEAFCFDNGYRVKKPKNFRKTTDSRGITRFPNLIKGFEVTGVNQVFVSDITFFEMNGRFYFITLIMDLFNREIVGSCASISLRTEDTTLPAMLAVIKTRGKCALEGAIIHSDGGGQYYSHVFRALTKRLKMSNSMTEESVYENSHAERLNGTIKNSYLYPYAPETFEGLKKELKRAVYMYNNGKPHSALGRLSPVQYRKAHSVGTGNNPPQVPGCFPVPTENQHQHNTDFDIEKKKKLKTKTVNVI